jgi:hypothetical protein
MARDGELVPGVAVVAENSPLAPHRPAQRWGAHRYTKQRCRHSSDLCPPAIGIVQDRTVPNRPALRGRDHGDAVQLRVGWAGFGCLPTIDVVQNRAEISYCPAFGRCNHHNAQQTAGSSCASHRQPRAIQLTLPTPEGRGCSGDAGGTPLRERLTGQPGPPVGWSVVSRLRSSGRTGSSSRTAARQRKGPSSPCLKTGAFWPQSGNGESPHPCHLCLQPTLARRHCCDTI